MGRQRADTVGELVARRHFLIKLSVERRRKIAWVGVWPPNSIRPEFCIIVIDSRVSIWKGESREIVASLSTPSFSSPKSSKQDTIAKLLEDEKLVIEPLAYIRGSSLVKLFIIVGEAQNLTPPMK